MRMGMIGRIVIAALLAAGGTTAQATYIATFTQVGANVVVTGGGSLNLSGLTFDGAFPGSVLIAQSPSLFGVQLGPPTNTTYDDYDVIFSGSGTFGTGALRGFNSGSGPSVGFLESSTGDALFVPVGYVSGTVLATTTDTFNSVTFASLGLTPGTYSYTYALPQGLSDTFVIQIIPEPESAALIGVGLLGLLVMRRKRDPKGR